MKKVARFRSVSTLALLLLSMTVCAANEKKQEVIEPVTTFALLSGQTTLGEPVRILFKARNGSSSAVEIDLGHTNKANFRFVITTPDGRTVAVPPLFTEGFGEIGRIALPPGDTFESELVLNEWYDDLNMTGRYEIAASLDGRPATKLALEVLPRDEAKLEQLAKSLLAAAQTLDVEKRFAAERLLSYIHDRVAVPYLVKLIEMNEPFGVYGLGRIATPEAIDILIANASNPDVAVRAAVWNVLMRIRRKADPAVTRRIDKAIEKGPRLGKL